MDSSIHQNKPASFSCFEAVGKFCSSRVVKTSALIVISAVAFGVLGALAQHRIGLFSQMGRTTSTVIGLASYSTAGLITLVGLPILLCCAHRKK